MHLCLLTIMYSSPLDAILDNLLRQVGERGDILLEVFSLFPNWELLSMHAHVASNSAYRSARAS